MKNSIEWLLSSLKYNYLLQPLGYAWLCTALFYWLFHIFLGLFLHLLQGWGFLEVSFSWQTNNVSIMTRMNICRPGSNGICTHCWGLRQLCINENRSKEPLSSKLHSSSLHARNVRTRTFELAHSNLHDRTCKLEWDSPNFHPLYLCSQTCTVRKDQYFSFVELV